MAEIWAIVFGLAVLLALAVMLQPLAKILRIPYTVVLAAVGAALALFVQWLGIDVGAGHAHDVAQATADAGANGVSDSHDTSHADGHGSGSWWQQALGALTGLSITADVILFVFLPALVFESALSLDLRKLQKELGAILFLAIAGVLMSTIIAGVTLSTYSGVALVACLLVGAIVSATDPVAVIALFKELGAPKRLTILVEGESLFNDATAIVVATIFLALLTSTAEPDVTAAALNFLRVFGVGIIVGAVIARIAIAIMVPFKDQAISVVSLSLVMPFIAFVVAEHFLHVSGVMAAVVGGLALGSHGRRVIPPQIFTEIEHVWHQIAFWATALIFILVGIAVPSLLGSHLSDYIDDAILLFGVATVARTLIIFGFVPLLSGIGLVEKVSRAFQAIMVWGGLRGAVSLALALVVLDTPGVSDELKSFVGVLVTVFVLATLVFQATTISWLMNKLGLGELSPVDRTMKNRSIAWAQRSVASELSGLVKDQHTNSSSFDDILADYQHQASSAETAATGDDLTVGDWVQLGLVLALGQERQFYLEAYGDGAVSSGRRRELLARVEDTIDTVRNTNLHITDDPKALWEALEKSVQHTPKFQRALGIQRRFGLTSPLAGALATRFSVLSAMRAALHRQEREGLSAIDALLPPAAREVFQATYHHRRTLIDKAHNALFLQYPDFALGVDRRNVVRTGLRLEGLAYDRLKENGLIGPEVFNDLMVGLSTRDNKAKMPRLRLDYRPTELIGHVPLFAGTSEGERRKIASKLRTQFFPPGEVILRQGDDGDSMFFIADGAVEIKLPNGESVELGSGEFFGEIALVTGDPRTADVVSEGYSTLLKLRKRDFDDLVDRIPSIGRQIRDVARARRRS